MGAIFAKIYEKYKTFAGNLVNRLEEKKNKNICITY